MRVGSLFAGIGGFDIATEALGWTTAWFSEVDPYCCRVLEKRWPSVPNHGDITAIDWDAVEPVDVLTGGFPCQPVSYAGSRKGEQDDRWLWPEMARAIRLLRPRIVVAENTPGLLTRGMDAVLGGLARIGYDAEWQVLSTAALGGPHLRERVWIVAYPHDQSQPVGPLDGQEWPGVPQGYSGEAWALPEPTVDRVDDGIPHRMDRLRALGNAIVPACALAILEGFVAATEREVA